jgi:hypothetical protein
MQANKHETFAGKQSAGLKPCCVNYYVLTGQSATTPSAETFAGEQSAGLKPCCVNSYVLTGQSAGQTQDIYRKSAAHTCRGTQGKGIERKLYKQ